MPTFIDCALHSSRDPREEASASIHWFYANNAEDTFWNQFLKLWKERKAILPPRHCMGMTGNCEWILRPEVTDASPETLASLAGQSGHRVYRAPEQFRKGWYTGPPNDCWGMGLAICELAMGYMLARWINVPVWSCDNAFRSCLECGAKLPERLSNVVLGL